MNINRICKIQLNKPNQNYIYLNYNLNQEDFQNVKIQKIIQIKLVEYKIHKRCVKIQKNRQIEQKYNYQLMRPKNQYNKNNKQNKKINLH